MPADRRPTLQERRMEGRALRSELSRKDQGDWRLAAHRPDPVALLQEAVRGRDPDALPLRWGRMAASPFTFFRGNVALMAWDLTPAPVTGLACQLCGDPHLLNLGAFASPDGDLIFDLNDFDETCRGPWEWDLKRMVVSVLLGGGDSGHTTGSALVAVRACVETYRRALHDYAEMGAADLARTSLSPGDGHPTLGPIFEKAARDTSASLFKKAVDPERRTFLDLPPGLRPLGEAEAEPFRASLAAYQSTLPPAWSQVFSHYAPTAFGRRISGCGSMGVRNVLMLCEGNGPEDLLFLEFKAQPGSAWAASTEADPEAHRGQAVCWGQQRVQTWSDPFLGWTTVGGSPYLVKQWSNHKASLSTKDLEEGALEAYARICGSILAKGHARSGDPGRLSGYVGDSEALDEAMATFAETYAEQVHQDWERLKEAIRRGGLQAIAET